ncbi:unnamed protein product [Malus baccata var. baccata]
MRIRLRPNLSSPLRNHISFGQQSRESMEDVSNEVTNRNLNDLPDEILLHILTFLPTLDAVQASLISHNWQPLWSHVPALNFNYKLFPLREPPLDTRQLYVEFVDRVLVSRTDSRVSTFHLSFIHHNHYSSHVDSWVRSAVTCLRTRELYLDFFIHKKFHNEDTRTNWYAFPFSVLRDGCVEKLRLTRCEVILPPELSTMRFWSIGSLFLDQIYFSDKMMGDLILGCPSLEDLELQNCWGHRHLKICSKRLKKLVLGHFYDDSYIRARILVDCPNLCSISFDCCSFYMFELKNASFLVEFRVIVHLIDLSDCYWIRVVRLLEQVPNLKHLYVQNWWCKFATSDFLPESFRLHNLKLLELRTGFTQYDLIGMLVLIELSPNLEAMILEHQHKIEADNEILSEELLDNPVDLSIPSLKQVTIKPYTGTEDEANFVNILIRQGVVLEKIVLVPGRVEENPRVVLKPLPPVVLQRKDFQSWKCTLSSVTPPVDN